MEFQVPNPTAEPIPEIQIVTSLPSSPSESIPPVRMSPAPPTPTTSTPPPALACGDISEFLDDLKKMRVMDDKITQALNTSIPTESFKNKVDATATCRDLFTRLVANYNNRDNAIQNCISASMTQVEQFRHDRDEKPNDVPTLKQLRKEQSKLRQLQTEVDVEEVIRGRSLKLYHEKCRTFYKPPA